MEKCKIYHKDGAFLIDVKSLTMNDRLMGENSVSISINSPIVIDFKIGDYLIYRGHKYVLAVLPSVQKQARVRSVGNAIVYDSVKFISEGSDMALRREMRDEVLDNITPHSGFARTWTVYCESIITFAERWLANMDKLFRNQWEVYVRLEDGTDIEVGKHLEMHHAKAVGNKKVVVSVSNENCWDTLKHVKDDFNVNFYMQDKKIYFGANGSVLPPYFQYGKGKGLFKFERTSDDSQAIVTRLHAYGNNKNLPNRFYQNVMVECYIGKSAAKKVSSGVGYVQIDIPNETAARYPFSEETELDFLRTYKRYDFDAYIKVGGRTIPLIAYIGKNTDPLLDSYLHFTTYDGNPASSLDELKEYLATEDWMIFVDSNIDQTKWPVNQKIVSDPLIPNNVYIDSLMLPGFGQRSLAEVVREAYETGKAGKLQELGYKTWEELNEEFVFSDDKDDPYIDARAQVADYGIREGSVTFDGSGDEDEIYPSIEHTGSNIIVDAEQIEDDGVVDGTGGDGTPDKETFWVDVILPFNPKKCISYGRTDFTVSMKDGMCGGREFTCTSVSDKGDGMYRLTLQRKEDMVWYPNNPFNVKAGDKFVLTDIDMPREVVEETALNALLPAALKVLVKNCEARFKYHLTIDNIEMARQHEASINEGAPEKSVYGNIKAGDMILFGDADLGINYEDGINAGIVIDTVEIKEGDADIPKIDVTLVDEVSIGTLQSLQNKIDGISQGMAMMSAMGGSISMTAIRRRFLSKINDDSAIGHITFNGGISMGRLPDVALEHDEDGNPVQDNRKGLTLDKFGNVATGDYAPGVLGSGFALTRFGETADSYLEIDRLLVRKIATFVELQIQKLSHVGGQILITPASMKASRVEYLDAQNKATEENKAVKFRCYFDSTDGNGNAVNNEFEAGDMARCQTFNLVSSADGTKSNTYYWRKVVATGDNYIDLSNVAGEYDAGSIIPKTSDEIVQLGNVSKKERQTAIMLSAYGTDAPSIKTYANINTFSLDNKEVTFQGYVAATGRMLYKIFGDFYVGDRGETNYIRYDQDNGVEILANKIALKTEYDQNVDLQERLELMGTDIDKVQMQADRQFTIWIADEETSMDGLEAEWEREGTMAEHDQDIFYDVDGGFAYRFIYHEDKTYTWQLITDQETLRALEIAKTKKRVFLAQPIPPYDEGDLWVKVVTYTDADGNEQTKKDMMTCITAKSKGEAFSEDDWTPAAVTHADLELLGNAFRLFVESTDGKLVEIEGKITDEEASLHAIVENGKEEIDKKIETVAGFEASARENAASASQSATLTTQKYEAAKEEADRAEGIKDEILEVQTNVAAIETRVNEKGSSISSIAGTVNGDAGAAKDAMNKAIEAAAEAFSKGESGGRAAAEAWVQDTGSTGAVSMILQYSDGTNSFIDLVSENINLYGRVNFNSLNDAIANQMFISDGYMYIGNTTGPSRTFTTIGPAYVSLQTLYNGQVRSVIITDGTVSAGSINATVSFSLGGHDVEIVRSLPSNASSNTTTLYIVLGK